MNSDAQLQITFRLSEASLQVATSVCSCAERTVNSSMSHGPWKDQLALQIGIKIQEMQEYPTAPGFLKNIVLLLLLLML
uniref:Uncharacterized protein n=1 Tax=Oryza sativa subsp. japonica TaxID=39947 RepID=Q6ZGJ1_ORYSJ|nr:hypothetical protein [Oryza sativa Japonica Group]BAD16941.1 hypothetical protein [Oryza sativa Japonica Group]